MALRSLTPVPITSLPAATTPLSGTEAVAVVQSGTTSQVAVSDLTAGRSVSASALTASSGNLTFSGAAQRITGDMSNATVANRLMFQTSTANSSTSVNAIPSGTGTTANIRAVNNSTPTNASFVGVDVTATEAQIVSGVYGTGTNLPMAFYTGGSERVRIDTSGNVGIGTASPASKFDVYAVSGTVTGYIRSAGATGTDIANFYTLAGSTSVQSVAYGNGSGFLLAAASSSFTVGNSSNAPLIFTTNNTERMRIDSSGNVGIGTAANLSTLTVNGSFAPKAPSTVNAANYSVAATDYSLRFTTTNCTVTLPTASSFPGRILVLNTITANSVTSNASNVIPLGSNTAGTAILAATAGKFTMIQSDGTNWITLLSN